MIGFVLVLFASLGICISLNVQKYVHLKNTDPNTGQPMVSFASLPLWWLGVVGNIVSEILNLAALGYAPATLVTPLGCLTVVFNAIAASVMLGEPFLRRDVLGIFFIFVGVLCVVFSQVGDPSPPITPSCNPDDPSPCTGLNEVLGSWGFWVLVLGVGFSLFVLLRYVHAKWCQKYAWVYLTESSLVSSLTIVSARCFASFLPPPMPGKWEYFWRSPDWLYTWGSLICMGATAVAGLLLQNAALMYFKASEVVPLYFCLFAIGGVAGAGLAFGELSMPWLLLLGPGVGFCIAGVFTISYKRDERIDDRITTAAGVDSNASMPPVDGLRYTPADRRTTGCGHTGVDPMVSQAMSGLERSTTGCDGFGARLRGSSGSSKPQRLTSAEHTAVRAEDDFFGWGRSRGASMPATMVSGRDGGGDGGGQSRGGPGGGSSNSMEGAHPSFSMPRTGSEARDCSRMSMASEACSVVSMASVASAAAIEEAAFMTLGGGSLASMSAIYRMSRTSFSEAGGGSYSCLPPGVATIAAAAATASRGLHNVVAEPTTEPFLQPGRFGLAGAQASEVLLPREALLEEAGHGEPSSKM